MNGVADEQPSSARSVSASRESALEESEVIQAVQEYQAALRAGACPDRGALLARFPAIAPALAECLDGLEFVQAAVPGLSGPGLARTEVNPDCHLSGAEPLGDFRILREVGRGGMGVVYEAVQISLGRRVALKVLPLAGALDQRQLQRFQHEAKAAALLHHPNIVPVHAVGCDRGVNYFAMQFIEGATLARVIDAVHRPAAGPAKSTDATGDYQPGGPEPATPLPAGLTTEGSRPGREFYRAVARLMAQAAEALEYAHGLGVVHRDVKPGNLLLDAAGHLWLTDFGLARFEAGADLTGSGDLLGTLRYMAPEQALAIHGLVDHRADVYALGATLYELLTGKPAVDGADRAQILGQIAADDPKPLRQLDRAVPAELETVVLKALAKGPAERYATAQELADDLKRFLADEPIRAKRPTVWQRARRWARRNPSVVTAVAVVLAATLLASFVLLWREKGWSDREASVARAAEKRADANAEMAWQAAEDMYTQVAEKWLAHRPQLEPVQREFLLKALQFYERYARENGSNPTVRRELGTALSRVGRIQSHLGEYGKAEEADRRAIAVFTQLVAEFPDDPVLRHHLAACHVNLGATLHLTSRYPEAEGAYREGLDRFSSLVAEFPRDLDYRHKLASAHLDLGAVLDEADRPAEALTVLRQGKDLHKQLTDANPAEAEYRYGLSLTLNNLGAAFRRLGRLRNAEEEWREAFKLRKRLFAESPAVPHYRYALADIQSNLATLFSDTGRHSEAEQALRGALGHLEVLANSFPSVPRYRHEEAVCHHHRGLALGRLGRREDAEKEHRAGRDILTELTARFPKVPAYRRMLAQCHFDLGHLMLISGRLAAAEEAFGQALDLQTALAKPGLGLAISHGELADTHCNLGHLSKALGRLADAERSFRQAVALYTQAVDKRPEGFQCQSRLGAVLNDLALLLRKRGELAEPRDLLERAVKHQQAAVAINPANQTGRRYLKNHLTNLIGVLQASGDGGLARLEEVFRLSWSVSEDLVRDFPEVPEFQSQLGAALNDLGSLLRERGELAEARRLLEQAIRHQKAALQPEPRNPTYRRFLEHHLWQLASTLVPSGDHRAAAETARELALVSPQDPALAYDAACFLSHCGPLAVNDRELSGPKRRELAQAYGDEAIALLRAAVGKGFKDVERLKKEPALDAVRSRPGFKQLLAELEAKPK